MKAIIKEDIIVNITERGNVEIGTLPKGVGVERLRWDGNKLVDLADLNEFWVRSTGGSFELHAVKVPNSQLVLMTYANRNNLILENSIIRIKTSQELQDEQKAKFNAALKAKLRTTLRNNIGDLEDLLMSTLVLVASLVVYSRTQNAVIGDWFDTMIPVIKDIFPQDKVGSIVEQAMQDLKVAVNEYYDNLLE
jgi:hypothetical protein